MKHIWVLAQRVGITNRLYKIRCPKCNLVVLMLEKEFSGKSASELAYFYEYNMTSIEKPIEKQYNWNINNNMPPCTMTDSEHNMRELLK